jgi:AAT family amino acid transporter
VIGLMCYFPDTRVALVVGPVWLVLLVVLYYALGFNRKNGKPVLASAGQSA